MGYRHARAAQEAACESVAGGGWALRDDEDRPRPVTFKEWLVGSKVPEEWLDTQPSTH